ncbi:homeodomain-interacting protein kinase 4 [Latimeria chalumnae]|uniref:homeodomain-interacting protein kinase 4 n=1 Tax=Latimeria chalumnae TaxID=7897 RepID=UPI0003C16EC3
MSVIQSEAEVYDIIEVLGKGTFGEVTKCWKRNTGEMVAIKILKNDAYRSRIIKNELKLLKALAGINADESHIIKFYESFDDELKFYLVFELLEQNLFEYQKESNFAPLPVRHIRIITAQVLKALSKLKELSIIHADLKPENIMIVDQTKFPFRVKVIDFGSASIFSEVRYVKEPYIQSRFYRSPEILLGLPFCEKVDMWSLGCVMAELHLGWPLYPGNNEYDQIRYVCETQGMPKAHLLNAATKAPLFFKQVSRHHCTQHWQLKSAADYQSETGVQPLERRKFVLKSLDQIETVNITKTVFPDDEVMAEFYDLKNMVELMKRMLTLDSHERINPNSALKHPFITTQQLKINYEHTKYYQQSAQGLQVALKYNRRVDEEKPFYHMFDNPYFQSNVYFDSDQVQNIPNLANVQRTISKMDDLSIEEPRRDVGINLWSEGAGIAGYQPSTSMEVSSICPAHSYLREPSYHWPRHRHGHHKEPVLAYHGSRYGTKCRKAPRHSKSDPTFGNLIVLGQQSPEDSTSWEDEESASISSVNSIAQELSSAEEETVKREIYRCSSSVEVRRH